MKTSLMYRLFPTPNFLRMSSLGIDISDKSIKYVELERHKKEIRLKRFGERILPAGVIASGKVLNQKKLAEELTKLREELELSFIRMTLPEEQLYLFSIAIPKVDPKQIRSTIELSLEEYVPLPAGEIVFDFDLLTETDSQYVLQVAAISGIVVSSYLALCREAKVTASCFELEGSPLARALIGYDDKKTHMMIDFGDMRTGIVISEGHRVLFATTIPLGGSTLTSVIEKNFKISHEEAEKMKRTYGLSRSGGDELFNTLLGTVSVVRDEITKHYMYWNTHKDETGNPRPPIDDIILSGGNSNLIGLIEYLALVFPVPVVLGNVWKNMETKDEYVPPMNFDQSMSYATAIGLSLGDFEI